MVGLAEHKHVGILGFDSNTVDDQVLKNTIIAQPSKILEKNGCEIDPHTAMGFNEGDSEDVRFLLDSFAVTLADNSFELFVFGNKSVDIVRSNEVKRPVGGFGGIDQSFVTDFCHQRGLVNVSLPIQPDDALKVHQ